MSELGSGERPLIVCVVDDEERGEHLRDDVDRIAGAEVGVAVFRTIDGALSALADFEDSNILVPLVLVGERVDDRKGIELLDDMQDRSRYRGTRKVVVTTSAGEAPERRRSRSVVDATLEAPWTDDALRDLLDTLVTEYLIEHAPEQLERVPDLVDVEVLSDAFAETERRLRSTDRQVRQLRRTFMAYKSMSDGEVEATMIEEFDRVLDHPSQVSFAAGETIVRSGESLDGILILTSGRARLSLVAGEREIVFHSRTAGRIIGVMAVTLDRPAFFDVQAATDVTAIPVSAEQLDAALAESATLAMTFVTVLLRSFARRNLRGVEQQYEIDRLNRDLAADRDRLANALAELEQTQTRLIESEKLATLGQLAAGVGHELNNPVAAINRSVDFLEQDLVWLAGETHEPELLDEFLRRGIDHQPLSTREERRIRGELERAGIEPADARGLARLGVTSPDEARRVLSGGAGEADRLERYYEMGLALRNISSSAERITSLVGSLRSYARSGDELNPETDVNQSLEDTLVLLAHRARDVNVIRAYGKLPPIEAYPGRLNQVWTNLIGNALDAMGGSGTLTIRTEVVDAGHVKVQIEDDGPGIASEDVDRVFDLHFTTRHGRVEFGLGLGLRIARDIVGQHDGSIAVASIPGRTTFTVTLPVHQDGERVATISNAEGETP
jgi:signal transduction histidine kinase